MKSHTIVIIMLFVVIQTVTKLDTPQETVGLDDFNDWFGLFVSGTID